MATSFKEAGSCEKPSGGQTQNTLTTCTSCKTPSAILGQDIVPSSLNKCPCDPRLKIPNFEIDQSLTLLKYTNPFKVVTNIRKTDIKRKPVEIGAKAEAMLLTDNSPETQEVLDCIQEPRFWWKDGELWTQVVSPATTKRYEIRLLQSDMTKRLWMRHARPYGVCRVRHDLFSQLYDELSRQVTVTCAERGLFLVRIRAELKYTIQTYHCMWRDVMEYFKPIVEESMEMQSKLQQTVKILENDIAEIKKEMEEVHWKTSLLELDKAYERQAMLEWYRCRIEEERVLNQQLQTLQSVIAFDNISLADYCEDDTSVTDEKAEKEKKQKTEEYGLMQALHLSDTLKDLITERKVAEGRMATKKLLENEIIWVKGEISMNKAFLADLVRVKEPLDFRKWLHALIEGNYNPAVTALATDYDEEEDHKSFPSEKEGSEGEKTERPNKIPLMKWLFGKEIENCECRGGDCRREICSRVDLELLVRQAMTEYLHSFDDRPTIGFRTFFKKWLKSHDVRDVLAVAHFFEEKQPDASATAPPPSPVGTETHSMPGLTLSKEDAEPGQHKTPDIEDLFKEMDELEANPYEICVSPLKMAFVNKGRVRADLQPTYVLHHSSKRDRKGSLYKEKLSSKTSAKFYQGLETILGMDPTAQEDIARALANNRKNKSLSPNN